MFLHSERLGGFLTRTMSFNTNPCFVFIRRAITLTRDPSFACFRPYRLRQTLLCHHDRDISGSSVEDVRLWTVAQSAV